MAYFIRRFYINEFTRNKELPITGVFYENVNGFYHDEDEVYYYTYIPLGYNFDLKEDDEEYYYAGNHLSNDYSMDVQTFENKFRPATPKEEEIIDWCKKIKFNPFDNASRLNVEETIKNKLL